MNFEEFLKEKKFVHNKYEIDNYFGYKIGRGQFHVISVEDLGNWAYYQIDFSKLVDRPLSEIIWGKDDVYIYVKSWIKRFTPQYHTYWQIALDCLGKEEIEKRLEKLKKVGR